MNAFAHCKDDADLVAVGRRCKYRVDARDKGPASRLIQQNGSDFVNFNPYNFSSHSSQLQLLRNREYLHNMGCGSSKGALTAVDDSVHVMLKHDRKVAQKQGVASHGYVPRAEHPLMTSQAKPISAEETDDDLIPENGK